MPPFVYESALRWSDETVKSDIPQDQRIYILGPEKITETYQLDGKPATHSVEVRHAVQAIDALTLGQVIEVFSMDKSKNFGVAVYRKLEPNTLNTWTPFFRADGKKALSSALPLKARDVILIEYALPPSERPAPVTLIRL